MNELLPWAFVTTDEVHSCHGAMLAAYGGLASTPVDGCVDRSIGAAVNASMYASEDDEPDLLTATAYLLIYLAKNHCFGDGNKRVAWASVLRVVELNGLAIVAETGDVVAMVNRVATGAAKLEDVVRWLAPRLVGAGEALT